MLSNSLADNNAFAKAFAPRKTIIFILQMATKHFIFK